MPFEYLEDEALADVAIRSTGKNLNEVFRDTAMAICNLQTDINSLTLDITHELVLEELTLDRLLYKFLDEIIYLKDAELFFAKTVEVEIIDKIDYWRMKGKLVGCEFDYNIHQIGNDIKAITLHEFNIIEINDGWETHVIIDI